MSLPVGRPNADRLERRTLVPIKIIVARLAEVGQLTIPTSVVFRNTLVHHSRVNKKNEIPKPKIKTTSQNFLTSEQ